MAAEPLRRKRGRPRKYGPQNSTVSASLSFSPHGLSSLRFSQGVLKGGRPQGESLGDIFFFHFSGKLLVRGCKSG